MEYISINIKDEHFIIEKNTLDIFRFWLPKEKMTFIEKTLFFISVVLIIVTPILLQMSYSLTLSLKIVLLSSTLMAILLVLYKRRNMITVCTTIRENRIKPIRINDDILSKILRYTVINLLIYTGLFVLFVGSFILVLLKMDYFIDDYRLVFSINAPTFILMLTAAFRPISILSVYIRLKKLL